MKIGHISTEYKPIIGGAETYLANLYEIFNEQGWKQTIYQFDNGVLDDELELVSHAPKLFQGGRALDLWWFNIALNRKIKKLRSEDLLICHYAFHSLPLWWKKKVIVLSHGCEWDIPPTSLSQRLKIKIARWSFTHFNYLVANDTNYFRQMGVNINPKEKLFEEVIAGKWFIPNCVDINHFKESEPIQDFPPHSILVPRNISKPRGIHLAIEAFAIFSKTFPKTYLIVVGTYLDKKYKEELDQIINRNSLQEKVHFKGNIDWKKMKHAYSAAEMVVVPTLQREGTSLAALEGMSCGVATVSTNVQGLADLPTIQSDPTPQSLAKAMQETYSARKTIAAQQQKEVRMVYNLENWKKAWLSVVRRV